MAEDSLFTMALIAGGAYLAYQWFQSQPSSGGSSSSAGSTGANVTTTGPGQFSASPKSVGAPISASWRSSSAPGGFAAGTTPGYYPVGSGAPAPTHSYTPDGYGGLSVDTSQYKPQPIDQSQSFATPMPWQGGWDDTQRAFYQRCTYITGAFIPGCT